VIVNEGGGGEFIYFVLEGLLGVYTASLGEREIARLGPGQIFGEMSYLEDRPASATVKTLEESHLLAIRTEDLEAKLGQSQPSVPQPRGLKRKRDDVFQQLLDEEPVPVQTSKTNGDSASRASTTSPLLPPIFTLFRQQNTSLASLPSPDQLPSPPTTAEFRPRSDSLEQSYSARLPSLTLPSPRSDRSQPSQDDESAATLLLHMKARSPSFTSPSMHSTKPITPSSALGLS